MQLWPTTFLYEFFISSLFDPPNSSSILIFFKYPPPYSKFSYPDAITLILFLIYGIFLKDGLVNQIIHK